jgi:hypothetical protein
VPAAWVAPTDEIDWLKVVRSNFSDIFESPGIWPMFCEHGPRVFVLLYLPDRMATRGPLQAQFQATDPAE